MNIMAIILSFLVGFYTYPASFFAKAIDTQFDVNSAEFVEDCIYINNEYVSCDYSDCSVSESGVISFNDKFSADINMSLDSWFNYIGIEYTSDAYLRGEIEYKAGVKTKTEEFFLEPSEESAVFYMMINNFLNNTKANAILSLSFEPLDKSDAEMTISGINVFNRKIPSTEIYIETDGIKIGVDLLWGGALSYLEDTDSDVQLVNVDGTIHVDSDASARYNSKSLNNHVNLINRNDTGRLVQQSYYGTRNWDEYTPGEYNNQIWSYNPVQGGNKYNENSKIVDYTITDNMIYIKCQPLDWAKPADCISSSYMEAYYIIDNGMLNVNCRFVDFSGYTATVNTQELPAFYCVEPLNNFVYAANGELIYEKDLIFWPDANYPTFTSDEKWAAFTGEFDDSFSIGLYVPEVGATRFLTGVYERGLTETSDPAEESPTSYMAVVKEFLFESFTEFEYEYYITTGTVEEIRNTFSTIK